MRDWVKAAAGVTVAGVLCACRTVHPAGGPEAAEVPPASAEPATLEEALAQLPSYAFGQSEASLKLIAAHAGRVSGHTRQAKRVAARLVGVLEDTAATPAARRFACRQLRLVGDEESVPVLGRLLADEELAHMARFALEAIPGKAADQALVSALDGLTGDLLIGAVNSVGDRAIPEAVPRLVSLFTHPQPAVVAAAAVALGGIGTLAAVDALLAAEARIPAGVGAVYLDSILRCADGLVGRGEHERASQILHTMFREAPSSHLRSAALHGLVKARGEESVPMLLDLLCDADPGMQAAAAAYVRDLPGHDVTAAFAGRLPSLAPAGQCLLLNALAARGDRGAADPVLALADHPDAAVRSAAVAALAKVGGSRCVPLLAGRAALPDAAEASTARESLRRLDAPGTDMAIVGALPDSAPAVKVELIRALGARAASKTLPVLMRIARGKDDPAVRAAALDAIAKLTRGRDGRALVRLLLAADTPEVGRAALDAVVAACRQDGGENRAGPVVKAFKRAEPSAQVVLLQVLGKIGGGKAMALAEAGLEAEDPDLREASVRALADWPSPEAADRLLRIARDTDSEVHRVLALRGLARLLDAPEWAKPMDATLAVITAGLAAATRAEEKKLLLAALGKQHDVKSLDLVEPYLRDASLAAEACVALGQIVDGVKRGHRPACERLLARVMAGKDADVRRKAEAILGRVRMYDDYIRHWQVCGPYTKGKNKSDVLFRHAFAPEPGGERGKVNWKTVEPGPDAYGSWYVDLDKQIGGGNRVAYMRTWVWAPAAAPAKLELGSDDGVKAWLNGELTHANDASRPLRAGEDVADAELRKGWNSLLLKVRQGGGGWSACTRFRTPDGGEMADLRAFGTQPALEIARARLLSSESEGRAQALEVLTQWPDKGVALAAVVDCVRRRPSESDALAAVGLAKAVGASGRVAATEALTWLHANSKGAALRTAAEDALAELTKYDDYITVWEVSGPYAEAGADARALFNVEFAPETGRGRPPEWKLHRASGARLATWSVDLLRLLGSQAPGVAYLRTCLHVPEAGKVRLEVGSDDAVKVWLNGELVHANDVDRPIEPAEDKVDVALAEGWSSLLLKVVQNGGQWGACARFRTPEGGAVPGSRIQIGGTPRAQAK